MIQLSERDRDSTRFLWPEDPSDPNSKINVFRFKVVFFGATCSQFLLNLCLKLHLENSCPNAKNIEKSLYIDNVVYSAETESEIVSFYNESKLVLQNGGFRLREWSSNSVS